MLLSSNRNIFLCLTAVDAVYSYCAFEPKCHPHHILKSLPKYLVKMNCWHGGWLLLTGMKAVARYVCLCFFMSHSLTGDSVLPKCWNWLGVCWKTIRRVVANRVSISVRKQNPAWGIHLTDLQLLWFEDGHKQLQRVSAKPSLLCVGKTQFLSVLLK